ncbi:MAG: Rrf2 family transcriptional regulator [Lentisphaerae bacterium]|nr:Rrf2 family transcriptional regulator [Lentisphaerota bacterium]
MLSVSTKGRYAVRVMVRLALSDPEKPVQKVELSEREGISSDYLEQILLKLKAGGFVQSRRGPGGGFSLARDADAVTVMEILRATEGGIRLAECHGAACRRERNCATKPMWERVAAKLDEALSCETIGAMARVAGAAKKVVSFEI